ncbi:MAG: hypothetical protein AAF429_15460 [Pseudomonadota bacterium]
MRKKDPKASRKIDYAPMRRFMIALAGLMGLGILLGQFFAGQGLPDWAISAISIAIIFPILDFNPKERADWSTTFSKLLFKGFLNLFWVIPVYWLIQWFYDDNFPTDQAPSGTTLWVLFFGPVLLGFAMLIQYLATPEENSAPQKPPRWAVFSFPIYVVLHTALTLAIAGALFGLDATVFLSAVFVGLGIYAACTYLKAQDAKSLPNYPNSDAAHRLKDAADLHARLRRAFPVLMLSSFYLAALIHFGWVVGTWISPFPADILDRAGMDAVWDFLLGCAAVFVGLAVVYALSTSLVAFWLLSLNLPVLPDQTFLKARRYAHELLLETGYKLVTFRTPKAQ